MIRSVVCLATFLAALGGFASAQPAPAEPLLLGALEEHPASSGGKLMRGVRALFQKTATGWRSFPGCDTQACLGSVESKYPATVTWTIAFDGRVLGKVTARTPSRFKSYGQIGLQDVVSPGPVPTIGGRSDHNSSGIETHRSLVAVSRPHYRDPQSWKPAQLAASDIALARQAFRRKYPKVTNCAKQAVTTSRPWYYRDQDMKVDKAYASNNGWMVVSLSLQSYRCDGPIEAAFLPQMFVLSPDGDARFLSDGIGLVDAGDYDNDGKSELLFAINRVNRSGYELFYDDFRGRAVFDYSFH